MTHPKKKSVTSLQRQVAKLKEKKRKALKEKKQLVNRQREINEIRQLEKEIEFLKGVGSKRRIAKEVSVKMGKQAGKLGWKGLKFAGRIVRARLEAEAREQARDRAKSSPKAKPRVRAKVKTRKKVKNKPKPRPRVRAKVKNGRRR